MTLGPAPTCNRLRRVFTMHNYRLIILLLLLVAMFTPSLLNWMIDPQGDWYRPYVIWALVIVIAFLVQVRGGRS